MISFIICSHKAPSELFDCLATVAQQTHDVAWEVIVVNNGFSPDAERKIEKFAEEHGIRERLKLVREAAPGLGFARVRGFRGAAGAWLVLLDDDNTIAPDFCRQLKVILTEHPTLGGITPLVSPVWERKPPAWLVDYGVQCLSYNEPELCRRFPGERFFPAEEFAAAPRPPGGGMVIHQSVAAAYLESASNPARLALARTGNSLMGCEDHDIWGGLSELHFDVLVTDRLKVCHHISAQRLRMNYLLRLCYGMEYSYTILRRMQGTPARGSGAAETGKTLLTMLRLVKIGLTEPSAPFARQLLYVAREAGRYAAERKQIQPEKPFAQTLQDSN